MIDRDENLQHQEMEHSCLVAALLTKEVVGQFLSFMNPILLHLTVLFLRLILRNSNSCQQFIGMIADGFLPRDDVAKTGAVCLIAQAS